MRSSIAAASPNQLTPEQLRSHCREIFARMPDLSIAQVAKRYKLNPLVVQSWAEADGWLDERKLLQSVTIETNKQVLSRLNRKTLNDPIEILAQAHAKCIRSISKCMDSDMSLRTSEAGLRTIKLAVEVEHLIRKSFNLKPGGTR